mmetsp:Transcript_11759/g.19300  ORF Transcript_11759/g.19300 Transcript_11759/m.19300 type:complete len:139 (+) Transcript_11759:42-458(+)
MVGSYTAEEQYSRCKEIQRALKIRQKEASEREKFCVCSLKGQLLFQDAKLHETLEHGTTSEMLESRESPPVETRADQLERLEIHAKKHDLTISGSRSPLGLERALQVVQTTACLETSSSPCLLPSSCLVPSRGSLHKV